MTATSDSGFKGSLVAAVNDDNSGIYSDSEDRNRREMETEMDTGWQSIRRLTGDGTLELALGIRLFFQGFVYTHSFCTLFCHL
jgi:hypothetical protein